MAAKKTTTTEKKEPAQVAYVGPEVRQPVHIIQYQVFRNGLPKEVEAFFKERTELKRFLVPVEGLASAMSDLNNPESLLARKYAKAKGAK
ncbi:hypothetical protein DSLASN_05270 [Desulfoluna limicola]|uniref:Uncharacterized protein n=1 Tax=Desulfoluna limicola TaxID=2810562 RepID=A0ABM7PCK4_9BACT|nr:hypothetical protein [Desulfoluna limicola]BCS94895.1 hypothetical protein DSLASN_05270 [Desulfoluna limicola]